jgi:hypothetical protein
MTPEKILELQNASHNDKFVFYHTEKKLMWHVVKKSGFKSGWHIIFGEKEWIKLNVLTTENVNNPLIVNGWQILDPLKDPITYSSYLSETQRHIAFVRNPIKRLYSGLSQEFDAHIRNPVRPYRPLFKNFEDINTKELLYMSDDKFLEYIFALVISSHCCPQFYHSVAFGGPYIPEGAELYDLSTISTVMEDLFPENKMYAERAKVIKNASEESAFKEVFLYKLYSMLDTNSVIKDQLRSWVDCDYDRLLADPNVKHLAED